MANEFNNFFVNFGKNTIQKISTLAEQFQCEAHVNSFVPLEYPVSEQLFFDANVSINQVEKIVKSMARNKSPRKIKSHSAFLKTAFLPSHLLITSITFRSAQFSFAWKVAEVTTILKDGDQEIPNDYRPISFLPLLSKIREKVTHDQLTSYFDSEPTLDT